MQLTNSNGEISFGGLVEAVRTFEDATSMSLFQYTRRSVVQSRVYIDNALAGEEILNPLMLNIMNLYTGLILTAMNMNRYVHGTKKVRDAMSVVATEALQERDVQMLNERLNDFFLGSQNKARLSLASQQSILGQEAFDYGDNNHDPDTDPDVGRLGSSQGGQVINEKPTEVNLPSGRIIQVEFGGADSKQTLKVNLFLQLAPTFIPTDVAKAFVGMNFTPSLRQRWMQVSAGEISFIKDFLMGQDLRKQRLKARRSDTSGALKDMVDRQENALSNAWLKLATVTPERQNIANTILIFEKNAFDKACSAAGLKFKDYNSRQKFFNKTFAMMLCTIDPMFNKIEMYYHGLPSVSTFTFDQVKRNSKTESVDLSSIMKTFAQGMAPKF